MNLKELFQELSVGVLDELAIAGSGSGEVPEDNYGKLIVKINNALTALYTRFDLKLRVLEIAAVDGIYTYYLKKRHAQTDPTVEPYKYIMDSVANPFTDDVLMITGVNDGEHHRLTINDTNDQCSWHMAGYNAIQYDKPVTGSRFYVEYRARHPKISLNLLDDGVDLEDVEIEIPPVLEATLAHYIAMEIYATMSIETALSKSNMHRDLYEDQCSMHEAKNTFNDSKSDTNIKALGKGWA